MHTQPVRTVHALLVVRLWVTEARLVQGVTSWHGLPAAKCSRTTLPTILKFAL
jgi:hypothetical protein